MYRLIGTMFVLVGLALGGMAAQAQETCSAAEISAQVDQLYATYIGARPDDARGAAENLQSDLADLLSTCARSEIDAAEPVTEAATGLAALKPGRWHVVWGGEDEQSCPGNTFAFTSLDRDFMMVVDAPNEQFITIDNYAWPPLVFSQTLEGDYQFNRNTTLSNGMALTYEYRIAAIEPDHLSGVITDYLPGLDCTLRNTFEMTLVDEDVLCMVNTGTGANLRGGPGTEFARMGVMPTLHLQPVIGQAESTDGFTWWQLTEETWIRSDLVEEAGDCEQVPVVDVE